MFFHQKIFRPLKASSFVEIMLSLTLIGLVSILIFNLLIKNYKYSVLKTQLKETFKELSSLNQYLNNELGETVKSFNASKNSEIHLVNIIAKNLKTTNYSINVNTQYITQIKRPCGGNLNIYDAWSHGWIKDNKGRDWFIGEKYGNWDIMPQVLIDINGLEKLPNRLGYDVFAFVFLDNGNITPAGNPYLSNATDPRAYCNMNNDNWDSNGISCAYWALKDQNPLKENEKYWTNYIPNI